MTLNIPADVSTSVKTILIFPNPNNADSATFYVDNVRFDGKGEPVAPEVTIVVSPETITLESGAIATLTTEVTPAEADSVSLQWSTSDAIVAEVDSSGQVTALTAGSATIVATTADGTAADSALVIVVPNTLKGDLIVADFDEVIPTVGIVEPGRTQSFGAGGEIAIVANPKSSPANPSEQVLQFDKGEGTYKLIGFNLQVGRSLNRYETFSFQVYGSSSVSEVLIVLNDPAGKTTLSAMPTVAIDSGTWGTVTVDIPEGTIGSVQDILIFPNPTVEAAAVYYFDNVRFNTEELITYQVGDCVLTDEDFPSDVAEVVAVSEVPYLSFLHRDRTYMIGLATGIRTDGSAGAWEIHNDCSIKPLRKSGFQHDTSLLPDVRGVERRHGWRYEPTGISENGKFIDAVAINEDGYTHPLGWQVAPGTMVNVRFRLNSSLFGRIFWVRGSVECDNLVVETAGFYYFVVRCDDDEGARTASADKKALAGENINHVNLYPNPTTGEVFVRGLAHEPVTAVTVIDAQGRVVSRLNRSSLLNNKGAVDLSAYADGIYTIQVTSAERTSVHRVVVRK